LVVILDLPSCLILSHLFDAEWRRGMSRYYYSRNKHTWRVSVSKVDKGQLVRKKGIDTYVSDGKKINELTVLFAHRRLFFSEKKHIKPLLLREETNPLVEEGNYHPDSRDREGELYLTYEALTLLVEKKFASTNQNLMGFLIT